MEGSMLSLFFHCVF